MDMDMDMAHGHGHAHLDEGGVADGLRAQCCQRDARSVIALVRIHRVEHDTRLDELRAASQSPPLTGAQEWEQAACIESLPDTSESSSSRVPLASIFEESADSVAIAGNLSLIHI